MTEERNLREIIWLEKNETLELLLEHEPAIQVIPFDSGLEAEVAKIVTPSADYVLKVWNKASKPDVQIQYQILNALYSRGRAVSKPLGWGTDRYSNPVLLTSYDGTPVQKVNQPKLVKLAKMLMDIHKLPLDSLNGFGLTRYDFISYFILELMSSRISNIH